MYRDMDLEWRTLQALELRDKNKMLTKHLSQMIWFTFWPHIHHHYSQGPRNLDKII